MRAHITLISTLALLAGCAASTTAPVDAPDTLSGRLLDAPVLAVDPGESDVDVLIRFPLSEDQARPLPLDVDAGRLVVSRGPGDTLRVHELVFALEPVDVWITPGRALRVAGIRASLSDPFEVDPIWLGQDELFAEHAADMQLEWELVLGDGSRLTLADRTLPRVDLEISLELDERGQIVADVEGELEEIFEQTALIELGALDFSLRAKETPIGPQ